MARRGRKDVREKTPTASDIAEVAGGKGSPSDKREVGYVKARGRLVPGKTTPRPLKAKFGFKSATKGKTKKRRVRRR